MDSHDFYSEAPDNYLDELDNEPILFAGMPAITQLIVTNIFPEVMPGITMRMISLPNNCSVQAEPVFEYDDGDLVEEISQIDPFTQRMLDTGKSFVIGNKHTKACVRISIIKPNDINSSRDGVLRTLTRKRNIGRDNLSGK